MGIGVGLDASLRAPRIAAGAPLALALLVYILLLLLLLLSLWPWPALTPCCTTSPRLGMQTRLRMLPLSDCQRLQRGAGDGGSELEVGQQGPDFLSNSMLCDVDAGERGRRQHSCQLLACMRSLPCGADPVCAPRAARPWSGPASGVPMCPRGGPLTCLPAVVQPTGLLRP